MQSWVPFAYGCFCLLNLLNERGRNMKLFGTMKINELKHLTIGGCDVLDLAREFGTPLYIIDEALVRSNCKTFKEGFASDAVNTEVIYASKAFLNLAMCKIINEEGLSLDVVSGGELYTALKAGFPVGRIYMHGNNKTYEELKLAVNAGIGRIVVDNAQEMEMLESICSSMDKKIDVLLRVNPGIEAHTHAYIQTSKHDSKFGESIYSKGIQGILNSVKDSRYISLRGFHCHIGSQIFEEESFHSAAAEMMRFLADVYDKYGFITEELNLGGGFGVYYSNGDKPFDISGCLKRMLDIIKVQAIWLKIKQPKVMIEPGRAIIANAGTTIYEVGGVKNTYSGKNYIFVDGGMTDNPRTALYDAVYDAVVANKAEGENQELYTIAGKCCESGDILIREIELPIVEKGDIMAILSTGAYNYSMASNYNRIPRPAVVFVKDGKARLAVKRESYEDIISNDILF